MNRAPQQSEPGTAVRGRLAARRLRVLLALVLAVAPAAAAGATPGRSSEHVAGRARSATPAVAGVWRRLPAAPIGLPESPTSVWTGKRLLVVGRVTSRAEDGELLGRVHVAAAYDPAANSWIRLPDLPSTDAFMGYSAVWTGKALLIWGQGTRAALDPGTGRWRRLPPPPLAGHDGAGIVVWTGRELIGWGGGCCGDAFSDGAAYNPATGTWRKLAHAPLHGSQRPIGAWTGRELIVLAGGDNPATGKPWPAQLGSAAAYDPATDTWRRIAPLPEPRTGALAVWDGRELLVVGGRGALHGFAYDPRANRWRPLPRMELGRTAAAAVWTGRRLLVWGGQTAYGTPSLPAHGLAYDPQADRWSPLPPAPVQGRSDPAAVWTGRELVVWGGGASYPPFADGAAFRPARP